MDTLVFTVADNSIDLVGAIFFLAAIFWSLRYLWENHITTEGRINYIFIISISTLQIYQVCTQLMTGSFAQFRIWDLINYMTAVFFLMAVHRMAKREKKTDCKK